MEVVRELSEREWLDFLQRQKGACVFQSPLMFRVFQGASGYAPELVAVRSGEGVDSLLVSVAVSSLGPVPTQFNSRAVILGGPVGKPDLIPVLLAVHDAIMRKRALFCQIRNIGTSVPRVPFENSGYRWEDHINYVVDLTVGEHAVFQAMSRNRRRNVMKAEGAGTTILRLTNRDCDRVYKVLQHTYRRAHVPLAEPSLFESAFRILAPKGALWAMGLERGREICAVRLVLKWNGYLYDWYAGSTDEGREVHGDELLVWQMLKDGIQAGCETFDFGGAGRPGEPYGPGEFKRQFGGTMLNPGRFEKVYHPLVNRLATTVYRAWRRIT